MKLSEQLAQDHASGDFGEALEGYAARAEALERAVAVCDVAAAEAERLHNAIENLLPCECVYDSLSDEPTARCARCAALSGAEKYIPAGPAQAKLFGMGLVIDPAVDKLPHGMVLRFGRTL